MLWSICELDMYACLLGSGSCDFIRTVIHHDMLPTLDQQIPHATASLTGPYLANEISVFPAILNLNQGIVILTAKLAERAQHFRKEATNRNSVSPGLYAKWQATVSQLQGELSGIWTQVYPSFLVSARNLDRF